MGLFEWSCVNGWSTVEGEQGLFYSSSYIHTRKLGVLEFVITEYRSGMLQPVF